LTVSIIAQVGCTRDHSFSVTSAQIEEKNSFSVTSAQIEEKILPKLCFPTSSLKHPLVVHTEF